MPDRGADLNWVPDYANAAALDAARSRSTRTGQRDRMAHRLEGDVGEGGAGTEPLRQMSHRHGAVTLTARGGHPVRASHDVAIARECLRPSENRRMSTVASPEAGCSPQDLVRLSGDPEPVDELQPAGPHTGQATGCYFGVPLGSGVAAVPHEDARLDVAESGHDRQHDSELNYGAEVHEPDCGERAAPKPRLATMPST